VLKDYSAVDWSMHRCYALWMVLNFERARTACIIES
jgi:hypothetical protein